MTQEEVINMLDEMCIPYAYDHFAEGESVKPPFMVYLYPGENHFPADGRVYFKARRLNIEVYTDKKDMELELKVEDVLSAHEIFYNKSEVWIDSESLYEVLYQMEV